MTETPPGTGDLPTLRHEYDTHGVDVHGLDADPLVQFGVWFEEAAAEGIYEPHAMTLSTVGEDGLPSSRYVLLRGVDDRGFRFFTSYHSAKGARPRRQPGRAALTWGWLEQHRSVRGHRPRPPPRPGRERRVLRLPGRGAAGSPRGRRRRAR